MVKDWMIRKFVETYVSVVVPIFSFFYHQKISISMIVRYWFAKIWNFRTTIGIYASCEFIFNIRTLPPRWEGGGFRSTPIALGNDFQEVGDALYTGKWMKQKGENSKIENVLPTERLNSA